MRDDRAVLGLIEGLIEVFGGIWMMAELFWDLWKAWPRCLKVYEGWPSSSGTNGRLGRRVWRDWMGGRAVLGPIEDLADVFERIGLEDELFLDLWRAWPTSLKGLDEGLTCYVTYGGLDRHVWRGWMGGRHVMGGWAVLRLLEGLADVFEGVGCEAGVLWDLSKAWPTCLKGLHERPSYFGTYRRLARRVWQNWMRTRRVLRLIKGLTDVFEGVGWEANVLWDLCRAWPTCVKGLDGRPTCYGTYRGLGRRVWKDWMGSRHVLALMILLREGVQ